jgi:hypothetical protein
MNLPREDCFAWSVGGPLLLHATMRVEELAGVPLAEPIKEHLGAQLWFGSKLLFNLCSKVGERISAHMIKTRASLLFTNAREWFFCCDNVEPFWDSCQLSMPLR